MPQQLILNTSLLRGREADFQAHYEINPPNPAFAAPVTAPWAAFEATVKSQAPAPLNLLAIQFIHRFDPAALRWFLSAEFCMLDQLPSRKPQQILLTHTDTFFDIPAAEFTGSTYNGPGPFAGPPGGRYDPVYFNNILEASGVPLIPGIHVQGNTMAWEEINRIYLDNNAGGDASGICFSSISQDMSNDPAGTPVPWPHSIAVYISNNGAPCLDDKPSLPARLFRNKAGDMTTPCPPTCGLYLWPQNL